MEMISRKKTPKAPKALSRVMPAPAMPSAGPRYNYSVSSNSATYKVSRHSAH